jgi:hypothetical protein
MQQKVPWNFVPYAEARVETPHIFRVAKSTDLVPFCLLCTNNCFLPFPATAEWTHPSPNAGDLAQSHFQEMDRIYRDTQKRGASISTLWDNINHLNKLVRPDQRSPLKVVFPLSGGLIKAALVRGPTIVDYKMFYLAASSEGEAYYLMAILNSQSITADIRLRGSTGAGGNLRDMGKRVLEYKIPEFNPEDPLHAQLVAEGRALEGAVASFVVAWLDRHGASHHRALSPASLPLDTDRELRPKTLQNAVLSHFREALEALDALVLRLLICE